MRRSSFTDQPVTYGSVGGTQAADLLYYPPKGYRPLERKVRLGSGEERFEAASAALMTWGVQRGSGIRVTQVEEGTGVQYEGIEFDDDGHDAGLHETLILVRQPDRLPQHIAEGDERGGRSQSRKDPWVERDREMLLSLGVIDGQGDTLQGVDDRRRDTETGQQPADAQEPGGILLDQNLSVAERPEQAPQP